MSSSLVSKQKVLLYGARSNPLSYFLTQQLAKKLPAGNVLIIDTEQSKEENRMAVGRECFPGCKELPLLVNKEHLVSQTSDNGVSDIIDMTNGTLFNEHSEILSELSSVNFVRTLFAG